MNSKEMRRTVIVIAIEDPASDPDPRKWVDRCFDKVAHVITSSTVLVAPLTTDDELRESMNDAAQKLYRDIGYAL
jgi:hypothetical protein